MGWEAFGTMVSGAPVPVYGLGGLGLADLSEARQQGGQGIAGIGFWWPEN